MAVNSDFMKHNYQQNLGLRVSFFAEYPRNLTATRGAIHAPSEATKHAA